MTYLLDIKVMTHWFCLFDVDKLRFLGFSQPNLIRTGAFKKGTCSVNEAGCNTLLFCARWSTDIAIYGKIAWDLLYMAPDWDVLGIFQYLCPNCPSKTLSVALFLGLAIFELRLQSSATIIYKFFYLLIQKKLGQ